MTTEEAVTRVGERLDKARAIRDAAEREIDVLDNLYEALHVGQRHIANLSTILDVLREDES